MKAYPYKTKDGYCSILEAVDKEDACNHLPVGTVFCEIQIEPLDLMTKYGNDIERHVEGYLTRYNEIITVGTNG